MSNLPPRLVIVDFNHMAYKQAFGNQAALVTAYHEPDGSIRKINTNIQNGTSKSIHRWTRGGYDYAAVCFDRPCPGRRELYAVCHEGATPGYAGDTAAVKAGYKGGRISMAPDMFEAIDMTASLLNEAGVSCYARQGYEADDLILAVIEACRNDDEFADTPIDIVTGDADLLPLVDEQVSVFLSSKKTTFAFHKEIEKNHYTQVTPENYETVVSDMATYRGKIKIPYNMLLLVKMLRGDSSDNVPGPESRSMPPRRVDAILADMVDSPLDVKNVFRYGQDPQIILDALAPFVLEPVAEEYYVEKRIEGCGEDWFDQYGRLTESCREEFLGAGVEGTGKDGFGGLNDLSHFLKNYLIMDLNREYVGLTNSRKQAKAKKPVLYNEMNLAKSMERLSIKIPVGRY